MALRFIMTTKDKQLLSKSEAFFGIADVLRNVSKSSVRGFELELVARLTRGLVVNTAFTYVDARIDHFMAIRSGRHAKGP
jgi:iron complex outermembrane receptor protein